jgi:hypothetical protein
MMEDRVKLMQAMARLSRNPDFKIFLEEYIQKLLDEAIDSCITAPEPTLFQGTAQVLKRLIEDVGNAEKKYLAEFRGPVPLPKANPY